MNDVMVDLETMGTKPGSAIVAIGAVFFDSEALELGETLYVAINLQSNVAAGLSIDADTVMWWLQQSANARKLFSEPSTHIAEALDLFSCFLASSAGDNLGKRRIWGNGADFDNVLLGAAYERTNMQLPWRYYNNRCYRTIKSQYPSVPLVREGTHHNALDDAITQAKHLMKVLAEIRN